jgi:hypothetical protein
MKTKKKVTKSKKKSKGKKKAPSKEVKLLISTKNFDIADPDPQRGERFHSLNDMVVKREEEQPTIATFVAEWLTNNPDKWDPEFATDPCACTPEHGCLDPIEEPKTWVDSFLSFFGFRRNKK